MDFVAAKKQAALTVHSFMNVLVLLTARHFPRVPLVQNL